MPPAASRRFATGSSARSGGGFRRSLAFCAHQPELHEPHSPHIALCAARAVLPLSPKSFSILFVHAPFYGRANFSRRDSRPTSCTHPRSAASQRNSYIALSDAQAIRFLCPHAAPTFTQRLRNVKATLGLSPLQPAAACVLFLSSRGKTPRKSKRRRKPAHQH